MRRLAVVVSFAAFAGARCVDVAAAATEPVVSRTVDLNVAVATVNGDAITAREFVEALRRLRTRPEDAATLRRAALDHCVRFKIIQQLARRHGLGDDVSDTALRCAFAAENARRAAAVSRGEVIYGPRQFGWEQFRLYWLDAAQRELTRILAGNIGLDPETEPRRRENFEAVVRAEIDGANVRTDTALLARLEPNTPLPAAF
jgi:hypothetical protein